ncbi:MAG: aryl-sulfate sulfotransferase [Planctomycetota bacterium]
MHCSPLRSLVSIALLVAPVTAQTVYPTGTTIWNRESMAEGLTLFNTKDPANQAVMVSLGGEVVLRWNAPGEGHLVGSTPLPNGNILTRSGQRVMELDRLSHIVWSYNVPPQYRPHHELLRLDNGNTLILVNQNIVASHISPIPILDDGLLEVDPQGQIVWTWWTHEHFDELQLSAQALGFIFVTGGDWAHTNAATPLPANRHADPAFRAGNILLSQRSPNNVFIIDRTTGQVVWTMGLATEGQHHVQMIGYDLPGGGNILLFDNGAATPYRPGGRGWSRVVEVDPITERIVWQYDASRSGQYHYTFHSALLSGCQRLANGHTLICSGITGRIFEVLPNGRIAWEYLNPFVGPVRVGGALRTAQVYRAYRVSDDFLPRGAAAKPATGLASGGGSRTPSPR